jgi:hypothetical protein
MDIEYFQTGIEKYFIDRSEEKKMPGFKDT